MAFTPWPDSEENETMVRWYINRCVGGALRGHLSIDAASRGQAPKDDSSSFDWIRKANAEPDRKARRDICALTATATSSRGYIVSGSHTVPLRHVSEMVEGTRILSPSCGEWPAVEKLGTADGETSLSVVRDVVLSVALQRTSCGSKVVAVNAASGYHCGGGFESGGRHALEEAMCAQSSLFASLEQATKMAEQLNISPPGWARPATSRGGEPWKIHLPSDGAVLSPFVEIFRRGSNDGYSFEDAAVTVEAVVSVAMPNCNDRMSDSPVDAHPDAGKYIQQVEQKWRAVLVAACCTAADCLVVPDAGCGVFRNPPTIVGAALGRVLRAEFNGRFREIVIAFPGGPAGEEFARAADDALHGHCAKIVTPPPTSTWDASGSRGSSSPPAPPPTATLPPDAAYPVVTQSVVWEFSVRAGYEPFDAECQEMVEAAYCSFQALGEPRLARIPTGRMVICVDFERMTQHVEGHARTRQVRRRVRGS